MSGHETFTIALAEARGAELPKGVFPLSPYRIGKSEGLIGCPDQNNLPYSLTYRSDFQTGLKEGKQLMDETLQEAEEAQS